MQNLHFHLYILIVFLFYFFDPCELLNENMLSNIKRKKKFVEEIIYSKA